jgi:hypothetical protein
MIELGDSSRNRYKVRDNRAGPGKLDDLCRYEEGVKEPWLYARRGNA